MKKIKKIVFPDLPDARQLTPLEMNNLHFKTTDTHSPVPKKPAPEQKP
ncbi:MAG: hypothetical protein J6J93_08500 [Muribaculaceae bacterium]|nr:hypothetical protein [Muribaculaceae bacterium]